MKALRFCIFILTFASCSVGDISSERNYQSIESSDTSVLHDLTPIDSAQQIKISKGNQKLRYYLQRKKQQTKRRQISYLRKLQPKNTKYYEKLTQH